MRLYSRVVSGLPDEVEPDRIRQDRTRSIRRRRLTIIPRLVSPDAPKADAHETHSLKHNRQLRVVPKIIGNPHLITRRDTQFSDGPMPPQEIVANKGFAVRQQIIR
jgi:hypothetical protein